MTGRNDAAAKPMYCPSLALAPRSLYWSWGVRIPSASLVGHPVRQAVAMIRARVRSWLQRRSRGLEEGREPVYPPDNGSSVDRINFEHSHRVAWPYGPPDIETMRKAGWEYGS